MTTAWERITKNTYATSDWRMVVERDGSEWGEWLVSDRGAPKCRFASADDAMQWADKWLRGEARV